MPNHQVDPTLSVYHKPASLFAWSAMDKSSEFGMVHVMHHYYAENWYLPDGDQD